jgi:hypothetical protein
MPIPIGLAIGLAGSVAQMVQRGVANKKMKSLMKNEPVYKENPEVRQRYALAKTLLNARMPGAGAAEKNIYTTQGNIISNAQRSATDSNNLLLAGSAAQGISNRAFQELGMQEAQDYQRRYNNYEAGNEAIVREGDKVFNDNVRRFENKIQMEGAANENIQNSIKDISNLGFALEDYGMAGREGVGGMASGSFGNRGLGSMGMPQVGGYGNQSGVVPGGYNPSAMANMASMGYPSLGNYSFMRGRYNPLTGKIE